MKGTLAKDSKDAWSGLREDFQSGDAHPRSPMSPSARFCTGGRPNYSKRSLPVATLTPGMSVTIFGCVRVGKSEGTDAVERDAPGGRFLSFARVQVGRGALAGTPFSLSGRDEVVQ